METTNIYLGKNNQNQHSFLDIRMDDNIINNYMINPINNEVIPIQKIEGFKNINLGISGSILNEGFGQVQKDFPDYTDGLKNISDNYNLNSLNAGTPKQEQAIKEHKEKLKIENLPHDEAVKVLKEKELLVDQNYKYGSDWLFKPIPNQVVEYFENIVNINNSYNQKILEELKYEKNHQLNSVIKENRFFVEDNKMIIVNQDFEKINKILTKNTSNPDLYQKIIDIALEKQEKIREAIQSSPELVVNYGYSDDVKSKKQKYKM